jgi:nickel-dependent lactate racemase
VDEIYGVEIPAKADIVVTTAGGYPKDINLYQTGKTMDNACYAVKMGGVVILLSECPDIYEPLEFSDWFKHGSKDAVEKALRESFTIPGWVVFKEMECSSVATFIMVTKEENAELVRKANMIPAASLEAALAIAYEKCPVSEPKFIVMPQGANTVPLFGGKPQIG